jgi:hypothetical protein
MINLAMPVVNHQLQQMLADHPDHRYQKILTDAALRQRLVTYVLRQLPSEYIVTASKADPTAAVSQILVAAIYQGIEEVLRPKSSPVCPTFAPTSETSCGINLSHWFG